MLALYPGSIPGAAFTEQSVKSKSKRRNVMLLSLALSKSEKDELITSIREYCLAINERLDNTADTSEDQKEEARDDERSL